MSHDQKHPEVYSNAAVAQQALNTTSEWQVCPLCTGQGSVYAHTSTTALTSATCSVYSGHKIINKTTGLPPGFHNAQKIVSVLLLLLHLFLGYYFITKGLSDPRGPAFNHNIRP